MSSKPKQTALERHNARCSTEFCELHKAAPQMAEALRALLAAPKGSLPWDQARAALREAGIEP
jgi:hypothetical protein